MLINIGEVELTLHRRRQAGGRRGGSATQGRSCSWTPDRRNSLFADQPTDPAAERSPAADEGSRAAEDGTDVVEAAHGIARDAKRREGGS